MKVLIACEESQVVCTAFREKGHEAYSCDIIECSGGHPEWHIMQDCIPLLNGRCEFFTMDGKLHKINDRWDMIIAFPPCTFITKASARYMYPTKGNIDSSRFEKAMAAKEFFMKILNADCDKIAIENPTPLKVVSLPKPSQVIQPYYFGHPFSKRTLLWLIGLPLLIPTDLVNTYSPYIPSNTSQFSKGFGGSYGAAHKQSDRSKTFIGLGKAMAEQWG